jgi:hypothetical protein
VGKLENMQRNSDYSGKYAENPANPLGFFYPWASRLEVVKARGFLKLFGLEPIVRDPLRIYRLDTALEIYASEAEALSANRPRPAAVESGTPRRSRGL